MTFASLLLLFFLAGIAYTLTPYTHPWLEKVKLDKDNRMLRIGFGKHQGLWFFRIDFWFFGIRIT